MVSSFCTSFEFSRAGQKLPPPRFELGTSRLLSVRSDQLSYGGQVFGEHSSSDLTTRNRTKDTLMSAYPLQSDALPTELW